MSGLTARLTSSERRPISLLASVLAAVGWGFGGIFARLTSAPGLVLTFYRLWLGAAFLSVVLYSSGRRLSWNTVRASWLGGLFMAADMAMFFSAVKLTSIVDVTVISAVQPALVLVVAHRLFGERMGRWEVFWILVAILGVASTVFGPGVTSHHQLVGDLLAIGSMLTWSCYWIVTKHARATQDWLGYTAGVTIVAAVTMTPIVLLSGQSLGRVESGDWLWLTTLALVMGCANLLMNWALRYLDASISSVIGSSNPIVVAVAAWVILGQPLTVVQICGGLVAVTAITVVATRHRQPQSPVV